VGPDGEVRPGWVRLSGTDRRSSAGPVSAPGVLSLPLVRCWALPGAGCHGGADSSIVSHDPRRRGIPHDSRHRHPRPLRREREHLARSPVPGRSTLLGVIGHRVGDAGLSMSPIAESPHPGGASTRRGDGRM